MVFLAIISPLYDLLVRRSIEEKTRAIPSGEFVAGGDA